VKASIDELKKNSIEIKDFNKSINDEKEAEKSYLLSGKMRDAKENNNNRIQELKKNIKILMMNDTRINKNVENLRRNGVNLNNFSKVLKI
jgi:hypothetical protein